MIYTFGQWVFGISVTLLILCACCSPLIYWEFIIPRTKGAKLYRYMDLEDLRRVYKDHVALNEKLWGTKPRIGFSEVIDMENVGFTLGALSGMGIYEKEYEKIN